MSRVDTKFVFCKSLLPELLNAITHNYSVLDIDARRISRYRSLYFDTENLLFYSLHHQGRSNRFKVRFRHYLDSREMFLEVKFKNNKGRTTKTRREVSLDEHINSEICREFMARQGVPGYSRLTPTQECRYNRISLACENSGERVTLDFDLRSKFLMNGHEIVHTQPNMVIAEVKQLRFNHSSPVIRSMRQLGIRRSRYSKYCMGVVFTAPENMEIKKNRFKKIARAVSGIYSKRGPTEPASS